MNISARERERGKAIHKVLFKTHERRASSWLHTPSLVWNWRMKHVCARIVHAFIPKPWPIRRRPNYIGNVCDCRSSFCFLAPIEGLQLNDCKRINEQVKTSNHKHIKRLHRNKTKGKTHASSVESTRLIKSFSIDNWHLAGPFITISQPNSHATSNFLLHLNDLLDRQSAEANARLLVFAHCALRATTIKRFSTENIRQISPFKPFDWL